MANITEIEKELLQLGPADRARVALLVWESLAQAPEAATDKNFDPHGIALAQARVPNWTWVRATTGGLRYDRSNC